MVYNTEVSNGETIPLDGTGTGVPGIQAEDKVIILGGANLTDETSIGEKWKCVVYPNDGITDDEPVESNTIQVGYYSGGV